MADYVKRADIMSRDGGARGLGLAGTLAGGLALLGNASNGGGLLPNLFGNNRQEAAHTATETMLLAPVIAQAYAGAYGGYGRGYDHGCDPDCRPVTKEVLHLTAENAAKDSVIAQLTAKGYTDEAIRVYDRTEIEPLKKRVCDLETAAAVNATSDAGWRKYVNAEFVHQPKAYMNQSIITCEQRDCCNDRRDDCCNDRCNDRCR